MFEGTTDDETHVRRSDVIKAAGSFFVDVLTEFGRQEEGAGGLDAIFGQLKELKGVKVDERELDRIEAIVTSMTPQERRTPQIIDGSRRKRIATGSGTTVQAVNQLIKQFGQMQKVMRQVQQGKMPSPQELMKGL